MKLSPLLLRALLFLAIFSIGIFAAYNIISGNKKLPVLRPADINPVLVDESVQQNNTHRVGDFSLTDQRGRAISENDLNGKIYLADFFFTTCEGICKDMSSNMATLQTEFSDEESLMLVSFSVTPEIDTPPVLLAYAERYGANNDRWLMLTGDKKQIYDLARKQYFAAKHDGDGGPNDMVHTENFVLVDKEKRIRGFYDGTNNKDIERAIEEIGRLLEEYEL